MRLQRPEGPKRVHFLVLEHDEKADRGDPPKTVLQN